MQKFINDKDDTVYTKTELKNIEELIKALEKKIRGEEKCKE